MILSLYLFLTALPFSHKIKSFNAIEIQRRVSLEKMRANESAKNNSPISIYKIILFASTQESVLYRSKLYLHRSEMRGPRFAAISVSPSPFAGSFTAVRRRHCFPPPAVRGPLGFDGGTNKYWDKFYKRHQNKVEFLTPQLYYQLPMIQLLNSHGFPIYM